MQMEPKHIIKPKYIPVNQLWDREDTGFTPWMAENIAGEHDDCKEKHNPSGLEIAYLEGQQQQAGRYYKEKHNSSGY